MSDLVDLGDRRAARQSGDVTRCRACSNEWFALDGGPCAPAGAAHGAVTLNRDGSITGYFGVPVCTSCRTPV